MVTLHEARAPRMFLSELKGGSPVGFVGPGFFTPVMGTGIIGVALVGLPFTVPGVRVLATGAWLLAAALLLVVSAATVAHHRRHPLVARGHLVDPVAAHAYGAPAMAMITVGTGTLLLGPPLLGRGLALGIDAVLWTGGTLLGVVTAVVIPFVAITRHDVHDDAASGSWLMPLVPPMVSAATGGLLVPHLPAGQARETLLALCYTLFGLSLIAGLVMLVLIWGRLLRHGPGAPTSVPTTWIALGVLGQSITAADHLGTLAPRVLPGSSGRAFAAAALVYGLPVWGFAMLWLAIAAALTVHTARRGMLFGLSWWSFTFPLGTVVTGTSALAVSTGLVLFSVLAGILAAGLLTAWAVVAVRTAHGVYLGRLLLPPL